MKTTLMAKAKEVYTRHNFEVLTVSKRFENVPHGRDRGDACIYILRSLFGLDWEERVNVSQNKKFRQDKTIKLKTNGVSKTLFKKINGVKIHWGSALSLSKVIHHKKE